MKKYKCLLTSPLGNVGDIISLSDNPLTDTRLNQGVICELKIVPKMETKKRTRKSKG